MEGRSPVELPVPETSRLRVPQRPLWTAPLPRLLVLEFAGIKSPPLETARSGLVCDFTTTTPRAGHVHVSLSGIFREAGASLAHTHQLAGFSIWAAPKPPSGAWELNTFHEKVCFPLTTIISSSSSTASTWRFSSSSNVFFSSPLTNAGSFKVSALALCPKNPGGVGASGRLPAEKQRGAAAPHQKFMPRLPFCEAVAMYLAAVAMPLNDKPDIFRLVFEPTPAREFC